MTLATLLAISVLAAAAQRIAALRVWGVPEFSQGFTGDASVHFVIIRHLARSQRSRFIENYLITLAPMSYPIAFHRFAGLLSTTLLSQKPWVPNFILHLLGTAFLTIVSWMMMGGSTVAVAVTLAIYLLMPSMWVFSGPAIVYLGLSERYLARLATSGAYLGLAAGTILDETWLLGVGAVMAALAILTAQFARQALFFCVPLLCLVLQDARPLLFLGIGVVFALLTGGRHLRDGLRDTAMRWRLYRTRTKQSAYVRRGMLGFFRWDLQGRMSVKRFVFNLMEKDPTRSAFWYPELLLTFPVVMMTSMIHADSLVPALFPPLTLYFLTLTERFNHLGEAYRYIEYNLSFFVPVLIGLSFAGDTLQIICLSAYALFSLSFILVRYAHQVRSQIGRNLPRDEISGFVECTGITGPATVFPVPMLLGSDLAARREDWKSLWCQPGTISDQIYDEYVEEYPLLKRNWKPLAARHGVTHVFVDKRRDEEMKDWSYDFSDEEKIAENEHFVAYAVRSVAQDAGISKSDRTSGCSEDG